MSTAESLNSATSPSCDDDSDTEIEPSTEPSPSTSTSTTLTKNQKRRAKEKANKAAKAAQTKATTTPSTSKQYTDQRIGMGEYAIVVGETELEGKKRPLHTKMTMDSILARIIRAAPSLYESQTPAQRLAHAKQQNEKNNHPRGTFALIYSSVQAAYELTYPSHDMIYHQANHPMIMDFKKTLGEGGQPLSQLASYDPTHSYHVLIVVVASDGNDIRRRELVVHVANPALADEPDPVPPSSRDSKQETAVT